MNECKFFMMRFVQEISRKGKDCSLSNLWFFSSSVIIPKWNGGMIIVFTHIILKFFLHFLEQSDIVYL